MVDHRDPDIASPPDATGEQSPPVDDVTALLRRRLVRSLTLSRAALFWERFWPAAYRVLIVIGFFVALSWLGLWWLVPGWARWIGVALFGAAIVYSGWPMVRLRWPGRTQALARIERSGGYRHRPLTTIEDTLAAGNRDPATNALWRAHQARMLRTLGTLKAGWPHPQAYHRDPWGLRVVVAMLLLVGFAVSGNDRGALTVSAFIADEPVDASVGRIDAWVTPPPYTRRPPIFLTGDMGPTRERGGLVTVPEGSVLVVRSQGDSRDLSVVERSASGEETPIEAANADTRLTANEKAAGEKAAQSEPLEHRITLTQDGSVAVRRGSTAVEMWRFAVVADKDPVIRLIDRPQAQLSGTLKLVYEVDDDFGVASAHAVIEPARGGKPDGIVAQSESAPRPLVEAPSFPLSLPSRHTRDGKGETFRDLTANPWAGSKVTMTLVATDEAGQSGRSAPITFTLPERPFSKPLARAVVEQRRNLALDANRQTQVIDALDMLMLAPDRFMHDVKPFLGMKFVYARLVEAKDDAQLKEVVDLMWKLALSIEDGDLSVAERALRDAQEKLRQALERGASDDEIAKLTQELREALQSYMQALAEQLRNNPQAMQPMGPNAKMLRSQDLEEMLRKIEELAKTGSRDAARQLLSRMQRMLENLQTGRMQQQGKGSQEMMKMLNELADMIQRQQELMDKTHRQGQQRQQGEQSQQMTREQLAEALKKLQQGQGELEEQLQALLDQMGKKGLKSGELGRAGNSMGRAREALGEGETGNAVGNQGEALDALRRGAQQLGEQMGTQGRTGIARGGGRNGQDPLGRPRGNQGPDFGTQVKVPDDIDIQRARRILEELRRRFSDQNRPSMELDYLERLLKRE